MAEVQDSIEVKECRCEKFAISKPPIATQSTVTDAETQDLTGVTTINQTLLEADLTSCKDAINTVIDRLQAVGIIE